jgi:hypothetical protein
MTSLYSLLICLVVAARDAQPGPQGLAAAALASTPYYRQKEAGGRSDPAHDRAEELMLANAAGRGARDRLDEELDRDRSTFGRDRADEHFGRSFERAELPEHAGKERAGRESAYEHFERAFQHPELGEEDENQMRRTDDVNHRRRQPALLDDPRRTLVHGWEAPHGKWDHLPSAGETRWEHRAGAPHRAEAMAAQISGRGEVQARGGPASGSHSMVERAMQYSETQESKALALLGEHENAEAGSEGIFGALKEGFESMYTTITITDYPYFCPCSWAKGPSGERQQLTMKEGGKCISAANEPCAKQSAGRLGLLLLAGLLVGRE